MNEAFIKMYEDLVATSIDGTKNQLYPSPMIVQSEGEEKFDYHALALGPKEALMHFASVTLTCARAIMGLDRYTKPGQGTEFNDVVTCFYYEKAAADVLTVSVREQYHFGVINYQHAPRIVRPIDWQNAFWIGKMREELFRFIPPIVIERARVH